MLLLVLTVVAGLVSQTAMAYLVPVIILLTAIKFMGVALNFMEMHKANGFWKALLVGYLVVFSALIIIALG